MISAIVSLPEGDVVAGFELLEREFVGDEEALLRYFESTYVGQLVNGVRNRPLFPQELWRVSGRADVGITRTNNAVESFHKAFASGLVQADHPGVWRFVESLQAQQNITEKDMADIDLGVIKAPRKAQSDRDARLATLSRTYGEIGDMGRFLRGVARNYLQRAE